MISFSCVLTTFEKSPLENLICFYCIFFSWKIACVFAHFWESFCKILMCSSTFCLSWKMYISIPVLFFVLLEKLMCSYKRIVSFPGKFTCFLFTSNPPGKFDVFLENSFKKVDPGKKNRYFSKIVRRLLLRMFSAPKNKSRFSVSLLKRLKISCH